MIQHTKKKKSLLCSLSLALSLSIPSLFPAHAAIPTLFGNNTGLSMPTLSPMLEKVLPSVVSIQIKGKTRLRSVMPEEFQRFFGYNQNTEQAFSGLGSGVILNAEKGYIVTNFHVIDHADSIKITLNDGREFKGKVVGVDEQSDIALLKIDHAKNLTAISFADSDALKVGDFAVAVGNPFGIGQTVTLGIVSALARAGLNMNGFENFIQTDAAINRGNSGGALINLQGELIGINTAIIAPSGGNVGLGFAIPSNMVHNLADQLIKFGQVKRGMLGIKGNELTSDIAKAFDLTVQKGAFVSEVTKNSPADKAGIRAGDVIVSLNDRHIENFAELRANIATMGAGRYITLGVIRDGKTLILKTKLENSDDQTLAKALHPALDGAVLVNAPKQHGVLIQNIMPRSRAARFDLQKGDLIIGVNRKPIKTIAELRDVISRKSPVIALNILRNHAQVYLLIQQ